MLIAMLSVSVVTAQNKQGDNKRKQGGTQQQVTPQPYTGGGGKSNNKINNNKKNNSQRTNQSSNSSTIGKSNYTPNLLTFTANGVSFRMVEVRGGTFRMGGTSEQGSDAESDEKPVHSVTLSSYYIGQTEVTQELWQAVMGNNPSTYKGSQKPVENVSWNDCQTFISKLNSLTGRNFRLPTEAEWEFAARGGNNSRGYKYSGSNNINDVAWYTSTTNDTGTRNVATKSPNELGIYDMSGNVWEWCSDWYGDYSSSSQTNPRGASSGSCRVDRGGSWDYNARYCRSSNRDFDTPGNRGSFLGFRLSE